MTINPEGTGTGGFDPGFVALPTPGTEGDGYSALVIGADGNPLGDNMGDAIVTGYSSYDEISTYLNSLPPAQLLDVSKTIMSMYGSTTDAMQQFLNNIDPSNPEIPPDVVMFLVHIDVTLLASGNIQMVSLSNLSAAQLDELGITQEGYTAAADLANQDNADAAGETTDVTPKASNWFSGSVYTAFLIAFMEMTKAMMQSKEAQSTIEVGAMNVLCEMAQHQADLIMETAEQNRTQHIAAAVMAGVSIALTIGFTVAALKPSTMKDPETGMPMKEPVLDANGKPATNADGSPKYKMDAEGNPVYLKGPNSHYQLFMNLQTIGTQLEKFVTNIIEASQDISIAEKEGYQKILEAYRSIIQTQMQKAEEVFKTQSEAVDQWINTLMQIMDKLTDAIQKSLS